MSKLLFAFLVLALVSCGPDTDHQVTKHTMELRQPGYSFTLSLVTAADSCRYIVAQNIKGISVVHSSNCSNHE